MKKYLLFIFLLLPIILISQSKAKLEFFKRLDYSSIYALDNDRGTFGRSIERGKVNLNFGINYNQIIRKNIWLKIGLGFTSLGEQNSFHGHVISENGINKISHQFLEIPTVLRFEFSTNKITPFLETGLSTMYYLQTRRKKIIGSSKNTENYRDENIQNIQIALNIGFGLSYPVNKMWETFFQTNIRCHLSKLEYSNSDEYLWSGGLILGVRFKL
jgi:hypothetical protein